MVIIMQINRLFELIYILLEKKTVTAGELAERFEVSIRTIYRDVDTLSSAGIPIYMSRGNGGGISLLPEYILNNALLTDDEKTGILSSLKAVQSVDMSGQSTLLSKLSGLFGNNNTDWIEVDFTSWTDNGKEKALFETLKEAVIGRKTIMFIYCNGNGEQASREVEPLKLCFKGREWYIYGFCRLKKDFRVFKLKRIKDLKVTDKRFEREAPERIFNSNRLYNPPLYKLKLRVSKTQAYRIYDEFTQYEKDENGDFIVEFISDSNWTFQYISGYGKNAEILEPESMRIEYTNFLKDILKNYL